MLGLIPTFVGLLLAAPVQLPPPSQAAEPAPVEEVLQGELDELAGGFQDAVSTQTLTATNTRNAITAASVGSGSVTIASDAFSGFNGIGNFAINTGHNNNVQSVMSVTVVTAPGQ